jgi:hypothetical protein
VNGKAGVSEGNRGKIGDEGAQTLSASSFSFGARRFVSRGPRRLFVLQKCSMSPVYEHEVARPNALLRVVSTCA